MIARSPDIASVRAPRFLGGLLLALFLSACGGPLDFPHAEQDLVILTYASGLNTEIKDGKIADTDTPSGFEDEVLLMFAKELGVSARFVIVPRHELRQRLAKHEGHLAAGWLFPIPDDTHSLASEPLLETRDVLVRHETSPQIDSLEQLIGQTVHAAQDSRQLRFLHQLKKQYPTLTVVSFPSDSALDLLGAVARQEVENALVDSAELSMGLNFYPTLGSGLEIGDPHPVVWLFPPGGNPELYERAQLFLANLKEGKQLTVLNDRYFGHLKRLSATDISVFLFRMENLLPRYQALFQEAQLETSFDWRLLAALAYQESHWDPLNTSFTGVRGMMMLTGDTADRMGVSNRLDPNESIMGGARYLRLLKSYIPADTPEPDRTWQALAAYNIGPGHFNAARRLAGHLGINGDSWFEMKRVLPLLARPEYYDRLKSGRARGGEAVVMVENIRLFYDIMLHHLPPYLPSPQTHVEPEEIKG
ncbi:MAG: membrane-bound lytic murein transglycosylase MltF [Zoogloeaceae bacterium]|jgi:membrane-bound lytic murein transglycosylase F|nr:membrane-bound lytic murein transglycosylase MltF [Zoogloeaceae bacterium]